MDQYDPIPPLEELDFDAIQAAHAWPYWELRHSYGFDEAAYTVIGFRGTLHPDEIAAETQEAFEALRLTNGFAECGLSVTRDYMRRLGASKALTADMMVCYKYVAAVDNAGEFATFATRDALRSFLGPVDSVEEAILLLDAHGFGWDGDGDGIRRLGDGWEALVKEVAEICAPIETDRVLVTVSRNAELRIHAREVWSQHGGCI